MLMVKEQGNYFYLLWYFCYVVVFRHICILISICDATLELNTGRVITIQYAFITTDSLVILTLILYNLLS